MKQDKYIGKTIVFKVGEDVIVGKVVGRIDENRYDVVVDYEASPASKKAINGHDRWSKDDRFEVKASEILYDHWPAKLPVWGPFRSRKAAQEEAKRVSERLFLGAWTREFFQLTQNDEDKDWMFTVKGL